MNPVKATLVGLAAWVLFVPMFTLTAVVLCDLDRRHSAADPSAVRGAGPVVDGARRVQRHRLAHRPVGAAAVRDGDDVAVCRCLPGNPHHPAAAAARPCSWRSAAGRSARSSSCWSAAGWRWSSSRGRAALARCSPMRSHAGRPSVRRPQCPGPRQPRPETTSDLHKQRERASASEPGARSGAKGPPRARQQGSPRGEAPRLRDDVLERPASRARHLGAASEPHDQIRAPIAGVQPCGNLRA